MKVTLFKIGSLSVRGYGFMIGIGFMAAIIIGVYRAKKLKLKDEAIIDLAIYCAVFGFLGAKILYIFTVFGDFLKNPLEVLGSSGFVVYGGIITGALTGYIYCRIKKLSFLEYFDLVMPEIAVAQGFGRIGCFLAGCCYGRQTDSFIGVTFPAGCMAPAGVKLIPTQLISSVGDFLIAVVLILYARKAKKNGTVGGAYLLLYGIGRFIIEIFRNDERGNVGFLSTSQFISIFIVIAGIAVMIMCSKKMNNDKAIVAREVEEAVKEEVKEEVEEAVKEDK